MRRLWKGIRGLGWGLIAFGLLIVATAGWNGYHQFLIVAEWPTVDAEVAGTEVFSETGRSLAPGRVFSGRVYGVKFLVRFAVAGRQRVSIADIGYRSRSQREMEGWIDRLPAGSHHPIRYNPQDPAQVSLFTGPDAVSLATVLGMLQWALIAGALGAVLLLVGKFFTWTGPPSAARHGRQRSSASTPPGPPE